MFQFYWPWCALLFPLPYLIRRFLPLKEKGEGAPEIFFPAIQRIRKVFPAYQLTPKQADQSFVILFSFAWFFLVLSLMQPEKVDHLKQVKNTGYDLMLAVDISASMQALDFSTSFKTVSRLDVTKEVVGKFIRGRKGDRIGLVTFGESAYMHVPLTLDTLSVGKMLNNTVSGMAGNATAIGDAIGLSVRTLRERPEGSRVLVLLTDGEDNASSIPPIEAAKLAKQYGIKIYTIGVGRPVYGDNTGMDEDLLKEIAALTGGLYFKATDQKALESIYAKIDRLEKSEADDTLFLIREPLYRVPLTLSALFLMALTLQPLYRRYARGY